jgi:hypothetical protein
LICLVARCSYQVVWKQHTIIEKSLKLAGTFTDTRTSQHSKFNIPSKCDVRNCMYAPTLLIKYELSDGINFSVTKVLKNMSYIGGKLRSGACHLTE